MLSSEPFPFTSIIWCFLNISPRQADKALRLAKVPALSVSPSLLHQSPASFLTSHLLPFNFSSSICFPSPSLIHTATLLLWNHHSALLPWQQNVLLLVCLRLPKYHRERKRERDVLAPYGWFSMILRHLWPFLRCIIQNVPADEKMWRWWYCCTFTFCGNIFGCYHIQQEMENN